MVLVTISAVFRGGLFASAGMPTFRGPFEADVEFLHVVVDESDFVVTHHHLHDIRFYPPFRATHLAQLPR